MTPSRPPLALFSALVLGACGGNAAPAPEATDADPGWTIDTLPLVQIGTADGDSTQQLFEISDAVRLQGGGIVVGNRGTYELRIYDAAGTFLGTAGRKGEGPGEFTSLGALDVAGDTVLAFDYESRQLASFDPAGRLLKTVELVTPPGAGPAAFLQRLADGRLIARAHVPPPRRGSLEAGVFRDSAQLWLYAADGRPLRQLGSYAGREMALTIMSMPGGGRPGGIGLSSYPFYRSFLAAAAGGHIYAAATDSARVSVFDTATLRDIPLTWSTPPATPPEDLAERYEEYELSQLDDPANAPVVRRTWRELQLPPALPVFTSMVADAEGWVWLRLYDVPWARVSRWLVLKPDGSERRLVHAPDGLEITAVGPDWVLGTCTDELGVESVRLYALRR